MNCYTVGYDVWKSWIVNMVLIETGETILMSRLDDFLQGVHAKTVITEIVGTITYERETGQH